MSFDLRLHGKKGHYLLLKICVTAEMAGVPVDSHHDIKNCPKDAFGQIPVLETAEGLIGNSAAIQRYVGTVRADCALYGSSLYERALVDQWLDYVATEFDPIRNSWLYPIEGAMVFKDQTYLHAKADMKVHLQVINNHLLSHTFLVGNRITLADIAMGCSIAGLYQRVFAPDFINHFGNVTRWFKTLLVQPEFTKYLGKVEFCKEEQHAPRGGDAKVESKGEEGEGKKKKKKGKEKKENEGGNDKGKEKGKEDGEGEHKGKKGKKGKKGEQEGGDSGEKKKEEGKKDGKKDEGKKKDGGKKKGDEGEKGKGEEGKKDKGSKKDADKEADKGGKGQSKKGDKGGDKEAEKGDKPEEGKDKGKKQSKKDKDADKEADKGADKGGKGQSKKGDKEADKGGDKPGDKPGEGDKGKKSKKKKKKDEDEDDEAEELDEEEEAKKRKKNPLDDLPASKTMSIDGTKRLFFSSRPFNPGFFKEFWPKFDAEGFSLYTITCKFDNDNKEMFKTSNLISGFIQRSDDVRKYAMGVVNIFGKTEEDPFFKINGAWLFRGNDIPAEMKAVDDFESYTWTKVDPANTEQQKLVESLFIEEKFGDDVVLDRKYFK